MSGYVGLGDEEYEASYSPEATREALEDPRSKVELLAALARLQARQEELEAALREGAVYVGRNQMRLDAQAWYERVRALASTEGEER